MLDTAPTINGGTANLSPYLKGDREKYGRNECRVGTDIAVCICMYKYRSNVKCSRWKMPTLTDKCS